jgi:hypothetical protein
MREEGRPIPPPDQDRTLAIERLVPVASMDG